MKSYLFLVATMIGASLASSNSDINSEDTMQKQLSLNEDSTAEQDEQLDPEQSRFGRRGGWDGRRGGWDGRRGGWDGRRGGWDGRRGGWDGRRGGWDGRRGGWDGRRGGWDGRRGGRHGRW